MTYKSESIQKLTMSTGFQIDEIIFNISPKPDNVINIIFDGINLPFKSINIAEVHLTVTFGIDMNETCHTLAMAYFQKWEWCQDKWEKGVEYQSNLTKLFISELQSKDGVLNKIKLDLTNDQYKLQLSNYSRLEIKYNAPLNGMNLTLIILCLQKL